MLITLEDYKMFINKRYQKAEYDNERDLYYTNMLIPAGEEAIRKYTENDFQQITRTDEEHLINESQVKYLIPEFRPIDNSVTAIAITLDGTTVDVEDYALVKADNTLWHKSGFWPTAIEPYKVTYKGGQVFARQDRYVVCKFIALLDDEARSNFTSSEEAESSAFNLLNSDTQFKDLLNKYARWHV